MVPDSRLDRHKARLVRYLEEQDGDPERNFKSAVRKRLSGLVSRAYLVRVDFGPATTSVVALCFVGADDEEEIARQVGHVFAGMFGRGQHLDIIPLQETEEGQVAMVAQPFIGGSS